jgi:hypothetical protein
VLSLLARRVELLALVLADDLDGRLPASLDAPHQVAEAQKAPRSVSRMHRLVQHRLRQT